MSAAACKQRWMGIVPAARRCFLASANEGTLSKEQVKVGELLRFRVGSLAGDRMNNGAWCMGREILIFSLCTWHSSMNL